MYKRKDFQQLMPDGFDIMVHLHPSVKVKDITKAVHLTIKGTNLDTNEPFTEATTEIFNPNEVADTVTKLLAHANVKRAEYTDVTLYQ